MGVQETEKARWKLSHSPLNAASQHEITGIEISNEVRKVLNCFEPEKESLFGGIPIDNIEKAIETARVEEA